MNNIVSILFTKEQINKRIEELAFEIERDYQGKEIVMICVLTGGIMFMCDLARKIHEKIPIQIEMLSASSYGNSTESTGNVTINLDIKDSLTNKDVLVVEDIIDTGNTLDYIIYHLKYKKPNSIKVCTLLNKVISRNQVHKNLKVDYYGFEIYDNKFVVGYGLDHAQKYRNLPYIGYIESFQN